MLQKRSVYIIRSEPVPKQHYVGLTSDVAKRLAAHNAGEARHTRRFRPWRLVVAIEFAVESSAIDFEKYLKSGSGRSFLVRHFLSP